MAEEPKFTIRLSKIKNNRVLDRLQMVVDVFYERNVKVTKENIKKKIASQFKKQNVVIFGAKKHMVVVEQDASQWYMIMKIP